MDDVADNTAQMYVQSAFRGSRPWDGLAVIATVGDEAPDTNIKSFKLGKGVQLTAFSEINYSGHKEIFTDSVTESAFEVKSYKLKFIDSPYTYSFSFEAQKEYKSCLELKVSGGESQTICTDSVESELHLGEAPDRGNINIATFLTLYPNAMPESYVGQVVLSVDEESKDLSVQHQSLPTGLDMFLNGRNMVFTYN